MKNYKHIPHIEISYVSDVESIGRVSIRSSHDAYKAFMSAWNTSTIEYIENFYILHLNRGNYVLGISHISKGGVSGTVVDAKVIFGHALLTASCGIILAHNHPSGSCSPSTQDLELTKKLKEAGELLDIQVLDHIIITKDGYYSFADEGDI